MAVLLSKSRLLLLSAFTVRYALSPDERDRWLQLRKAEWLMGLCLGLCVVRWIWPRLVGTCSICCLLSVCAGQFAYNLSGNRESGRRLVLGCVFADGSWASSLLWYYDVILSLWTVSDFSFVIREVCSFPTARRQEVHHARIAALLFSKAQWT
jgi:hypothetical protein